MISASLQVHPFDARGISRRFRHAAIFGAFEALHPGEAMRFVNDHDPLPLLAQLHERYGELLSVEYRNRGPGTVVIDLALAPSANPGNDDASRCCGSCG